MTYFLVPLPDLEQFDKPLSIANDQIDKPGRYIYDS